MSEGSVERNGKRCAVANDRHGAPEDRRIATHIKVREKTPNFNVVSVLFTWCSVSSRFRSHFFFTARCAAPAAMGSHRVSSVPRTLSRSRSRAPTISVLPGSAPSGRTPLSFAMSSTVERPGGMRPAWGPTSCSRPPASVMARLCRKRSGPSFLIDGTKPAISTVGARSPKCLRREVEGKAAERER